MRKLMFALFIVTIVATTSCLKNDSSNNYTCSAETTTAPDAEVVTLKAYLDSSGIVAAKDSRGFFYTIDSSASTSPAHPNPCSSISIAYVAKLTNGTTVDSQSVATPVSFSLNGVIPGFRAAIPLMRGNSTMNLYLPPSLAYGAKGYGDVPGNAILVYKNITLLAFTY